MIIQDLLEIVLVLKSLSVLAVEMGLLNLVNSVMMGIRVIEMVVPQAVSEKYQAVLMQTYLLLPPQGSLELRLLRPFLYLTGYLLTL